MIWRIILTSPELISENLHMETPVILRNIIKSTYLKILEYSFFFNCLLTLTRFCVLADYRSSHQRCFVEKGVLKNFVNFTAKHLCLSLFSIKLKTLAGNFIKKRLQYRCFPMKFAKILRTPILKNICERLLLRLKNICFNSSVTDMQLFPK